MSNDIFVEIDSAGTAAQVVEGGPAGASAYEVWLAQPGNAGKSVEEFLASLKGEKGDIGNLSPQMPEYLAAAEQARDDAVAAAEQSASSREQTGLDRIATAADRLATNADRIEVAADRVRAETAAEKTAADRIQTGVDRDATTLNRAATAADRLQTAADRADTTEALAAVQDHREQTALHAAAAAADRLQTGLDRRATAADRVATAGDRQQTGLDRLQTGSDRVFVSQNAQATAEDRLATAADRVQTGLDRTATTADRQLAAGFAASTASDRQKTTQDAAATAADRVQTALDRAATTADRVQTSSNATASATNAETASIKAQQAEDSAASAAQSASNAQTSAGQANNSSITASQAAETATEKAGIAVDAANASTEHAEATAADRVQTGLDRAATAADRLQTGLDAEATALDREATAADRVQTGQDAAATAEDRVQTGLDRAAAASSALASAESETVAGASAALAQAWAESPEDVPAVEGETPEQNGYSARHWSAKAEISQGIAGSFATNAVDAAQAAAQARDDAVAVVTGGTASLVPQAGKIPIAGSSGKIDSEWLDPLPGVSAAALHRSPNAVSALFVYDTSKDSDGGAWTEKCQHTSWYNETLSGKWLGAQSSEIHARYSNASFGPELVSNGTFDSGISGWATYGIPASDMSWDGGVLKITPSIYDWNRGAYTTVNVEPGSVVKISFNNTISGGYWGSVEFNIGSGSDNYTYVRNFTSGNYFVVPSGVTKIWLNQTTFLQSGSAGNYLTLDNVSVRKVTTTNTTSGDYFQLTTDGKFYALNKNLLTSTATLATQTQWLAAGSYTFSSTTASSGSVAISGAATASHTAGGAATTFKVAISGSVTFTVTGSVTTAQCELGSSATAYQANASTSRVTEVFRGNKRDFPRLAGIVLDAHQYRNTVVIYDLTEPNRPMWGSYFYNSENAFSPNATLCAMNGIIFAGGWFGSGWGGSGFFELDFPRNITHYQRGFSYGVVAARSLGAGNITSPAVIPKSRYLINSPLSIEPSSAVMCVLPGTSINEVGLPVPTIALTTSGAGGGYPIIVILHNGLIYLSNNIGTFIKSIKFTEKYFLVNSGTNWYSYLNPATINANFTLTAIAGDSLYAGSQKNVGKRSHSVRMNNNSLNPFVFNEAVAQKSINSAITNLFNTGHMAGDIRRTYLSDIDAGIVTGPELVTNGTFDTDVSGWDILNPSVAAISWNSSSAIDLTFVATGTCLVYRYVSGLVPGKTYLLSVNIVSDPGTDYIYIGTSVYPAGTYSGVTDSQASAGGLRTFRFVASQASMVVHFGAYGNAGNKFTWDNVSVKEVVSDRSYKARSANITGTLTKSPVATGSQLVSYSGFSAANYLREPYSADLDIGVGEWSVGAWVNVPVTLPDSIFPVSEGVERVTSQVAAAYASGSVSNLDGVATATRTGGAPWGLIYPSANGRPFGRYKVTFEIVETSNAAMNIAVYAGDNSIATNATASVGVKTIYVNNVNGSLGNFVFLLNPGTQIGDYIKVKNVSFIEMGHARIADRAFSSGSSLRLTVNGAGRLAATAYDGTTTRTVTTSAAYNTATWAKAEACYTTDGTLSIRVNGVEVAATRGAPLLTLNNASAVLTIGNSYALDAPFPGSLALLKLSATVPTAEQSQWMYEQEKQLFREGAQCCLPDAGNIVDLAYDDATDTWVAASAANISEWSGLVRTAVTPVPAGSYSKLAAASGVKLAARSTTSPGVDVTIPAAGLREELVKRAEAAARLNAQLAVFDYVGGFTASTTAGSTAITSAAGLSYPTSYIGARVTGSGIPADTVVQSVSGTTLYLSKAATATASNVQIGFTDFILPVGYEAKSVMVDGVIRQEGTTKAYTRLFDGFKETARFAVAPGYQAWVQIQATRSAA